MTKYTFSASHQFYVTDNNDDSISITGSYDTVSIGNGTDTISITGSYDTIAAGNGTDTVTAGDNETITLGNGTDTVTAGNNDTIAVGNGQDTITAKAMATITIGNGSDIVTAGAGSTIGPSKNNDNGADTVYAGANSTIALGNGQDTVHAGTTDAVTIGNGKDTILYDGLTPSFTVTASLSVSEEHSIPVPITLLPAVLGNEVINGFNPGKDEIQVDTSDFADYNTVINHASQVGANTVITQPGGGGTITLTGVTKSSLTSADFTFNNYTAADIITITGVPLDETLSDTLVAQPTTNGLGTWTLTAAEAAAGLQLNAGEPIGYPTPVNLTVTVTDPGGQMASSSQNISLVVNPVPPNVGVTVLAPESGDPVTETRLQINSETDDGDGGNDYINRIVLSGVPSGVTLSSPDSTIIANGGGVYTIATSGQPGTFNPEVDVTTPAGQTTNFNLGVTAYSDEPNSPEVSTSTTQNIDVDYSTVSQNPDFSSTGQSIWTSAPAFTKSFDNFLGIDYPNGYPTTHGPASTSTSISLVFTTINVGASFGLKAGFQSDLNINGGSFQGQLPFNVTLGDTYNKTNDTLEIDPTESQAGGGSFTTTGPGGSYQLDLILDVFAKAFGGPLSLQFSTNIDTTLLKKNSSTLGGSFMLPDGLGTVAFHWPQVNTTGSNPSPGTISSQGTSVPIFNVNIDPIAVVLDAILGDDPLKGTAGSLPVQLKYTILAATLNPGIDVQQNFNLNASLPTATLTGGSVNDTLNFGMPLVIDNASIKDPGLGFNLGLNPDATLENDTSLAGQVVVGLRALKASLTVGFTVAGANVTTSASVGPLIHVNHTFGPAPFATLYNKTFPVAFQQQNVPFTPTHT